MIANLSVSIRYACKLAIECFGMATTKYSTNNTFFKMLYIYVLTKSILGLVYNLFFFPNLLFLNPNFRRDPNTNIKIDINSIMAKINTRTSRIN